METLIWLWSFDKRWMFGIRCTKIYWWLIVLFQLCFLALSFDISSTGCEATIWMRGRYLISIALIISATLTATIVKVDKITQESSLSLSFPGISTLLFGILSLGWAGYIYLNFPANCNEEFKYFIGVEALLYFLSILPVLVALIWMVLVKTTVIILALAFPTLFLEAHIKSR
ncbi:unnamed protein product [Blepharisma stoltei]|uniref:Uncharacterized protein n=1 Tax=Blepharisma stoltei TaxID=1481888 RepID=A0AAU9JSB2_9CILI|nr:unnamed protein product [Blepharisma stoltei]